MTLHANYAFPSHLITAEVALEIQRHQSIVLLQTLATRQYKDVPPWPIREWQDDAVEVVIALLSPNALIDCASEIDPMATANTFRDLRTQGRRYDTGSARLAEICKSAGRRENQSSSRTTLSVIILITSGAVSKHVLPSGSHPSTPQQLWEGWPYLALLTCPAHFA